MLRGPMADTDAPPNARVRAATALMDRAGRTPAYAAEVRHSAGHAQAQATEQAPNDPQDMAREILRVLPQVVAVLPADEVFGPAPAVLGVDSVPQEVVCVFC
jgi:hypothetical protein